MTQQREPEPADSLPVLLFELEGQLYGVSVAQVEAIVTRSEPGHSNAGLAEGWAVGGLNSGEEGVPVQSLAGWVGLAEPQKPPSRLLLSRTADGLQAFEVDTPRDVVHLPLEDLYPLPVLIRRVLGAGPLWGVGRTQRGLLILVDLARRTSDGAC